MRIKKAAALAGVISLLGLQSSHAEPPATAIPTLPSMADRGRQTLIQIEQHLKGKGPQSAYYLEEARFSEPAFKSHPSYAWGAGVQLSALVEATKYNRSLYQSALMRYTKAVDTHWFVYQGVGGFCAADHPNQPDRYYDDNAWLILDFCDAYDATKDQSFLNRARETMKFLFSGEDTKLGGGIYWHEQKKESKNTCINAPAIVCALRLFKQTGDHQYLDLAQRLYPWTQTHLQDPDSGLYYDAIKLDGTLGKAFYTYNSALMIRAACLMFDQTKDQSYLREAERVAKASEAKWCKPNGAMSGPSYFGHLLAEAFLDLGERNKDPHWQQLVQTTCDFLWTTNRDPDGYFPEHWDTTPAKPQGKIVLMWEASAARIFFRMAVEQRTTH